MPRPISQRPIDLFYRSVFTLILVIALVADCSPLYPEWLRPAFVDEMHKYQFDAFRDPFFNTAIRRPWFDSLLWLEFLVLVPLNSWLLWGWTVDHPLVPVNMIIYAYHLFVTTVPCLAEIYHEYSQNVLSTSQFTSLFSMYGAFVALPLYMVYDAYHRISPRLLASDQLNVTMKTR